MLKELENFQTKVLKSISHEFGTPLNCAVNMLKICLNNVENKIKDSYILPALSSIRILKFSCSDFIDYSKIQFNLFKLDIRKTDLKHLLKKVIEYFQPLVEAQQEGKEGIQLQFISDNDIPEYIMSDPQRIMQVIFNLLTNALKFTQKGYIKIKAIYLNENEIEISVQDSGIGIQNDQQDNLFERKTVKNKKQETSGLGLIISNAIALRLSFNGTGLSLDSKLGEGSTFAFIINSNCNSDIVNRKYEMNKRKQSQLSNKPSHSEYNTFNELNQTIFPHTHQQNPVNQISYAQVLNQNFPIPLQVSPSYKFYLNNPFHYKYDVQNNEWYFVGKQVNPQLDITQQNMSKYEDAQEIMNSNSLSPKKMKLENSMQDQSSNFTHIDVSCNLSEAISIKKEVNVPVSVKFCPSISIKTQNIQQDQKSISTRKIENREENSIHIHDAAASELGAEKETFDFGTESILGGIRTERLSGLESNIQQINRFDLSGKFITSLDQKKNSEKINPIVSIDIYLERNQIQAINQQQDKRNDLEKNQINQDNEVLTFLNNQQDNIISSSQDFHIKLQNSQIDSNQKIKQINKKETQLSPQNTETAGNNNFERNIIKNIQRVTNDQFNSEQAQLNTEQQNLKQNEEISIKKSTEQKFIGGILQSKIFSQKKIQTQENKKKQLTFSNNVINSTDEISNKKQFEQEQYLENQQLKQQQYIHSNIQKQTNQNIFNYNLIKDNLQNFNQQPLNALNVQQSTQNNKQVKSSQNDILDFKDIHQKQYEQQSQTIDKLNSPSYKLYLVQQLQQTPTEGQKQNNIQIADFMQQIRENNNFNLTNDTYIKEINEKQSNIKNQNENENESDTKSPNYNFPSQLSPIEKRISQQNPCETSLVDHIDSNDIDQQNNQISLLILDQEKRSPKSNLGIDLSQIYQQIISNSNNRNINNSVHSHKSPHHYQQNQSTNKYFFNQSNFDYGQILNLSNQLQICEVQSQNNLPYSSQNYLPQQSQNLIPISTQNYLPPFNDHMSQGGTPRSYRVNSFQQYPPTQKISKFEVPLSAGYSKKSHHYSQKNIQMTTKLQRNNTQNINQVKKSNPIRVYSEKLISLNDSIPQISSKMIESRQSVKKTSGKQNQGIKNIDDKKSNDTEEEVISPLRAKCFSLIEQYSLNNSQKVTQQDNSLELTQLKSRKSRRNRTKSEFGVHKNIQEIKDALKVKICSCADILIADDTQMNRHTLKLMIQSKFPFVIEEAINGLEAFEKVQNMINSQKHCKTYKMIFMDIDMPKLNGYEATKKINEIFKEKNIFCPVIAHTAFNRSECEEEMNQCNMTDYAGKPISTAVIESLFARYIDISQITGEQ